MDFRIKSDNFVLQNRKGARVAEEARLESVYSPKGNRGFESPSFRFYIYNYEENTAIARFAILVFTWMCSLPMMAQEENMGFHQALKTKFIEGNAGFMSLVAIALIVGMAFCIERIIYLSLSEINAKKLMQDIDQKVAAGDVEGAKTLCRNPADRWLLSAIRV